MARKARQISESGYYHIVNRGMNKQDIFLCGADCRKFLELLKGCRDEFGFDVVAYCLMKNHFHLLARMGEAPGVMMKKLQGAYAGYFNWRHERCGYLFQNRFHSECIEDERYLLAAVRYIHNNPQKAGICPRERYAWSSWWEYVRGATFVRTEEVLGIAGGLEGFLEFSRYGDVGVGGGSGEVGRDLGGGDSGLSGDGSGLSGGGNGLSGGVGFSGGARMVSEAFSEAFLDVSEDGARIVVPRRIDFSRSSVSEEVVRRLPEMSKEEREMVIRTLRSEGVGVRDIARLAGMAPSYVSRVVNGR